MSKVLRNVKLTLRKTLATTLIGLIAYAVATLYNRDFEMIGWALLTVFLVFIMYAGLHLRDFIEKMKDLWSEMQIGKAMAPSKDMIQYALDKDLKRDAPHKSESKVISAMDKDLKIEQLEQQLESAKSVIETQNALIQEYESIGST